MYIDQPQTTSKYIHSFVSIIYHFLTIVVLVKTLHMMIKHNVLQIIYLYAFRFTHYTIESCNPAIFTPLALIKWRREISYIDLLYSQVLVFLRGSGSACISAFHGWSNHCEPSNMLRWDKDLLSWCNSCPSKNTKQILFRKFYMNALYT